MVAKVQSQNKAAQAEILANPMIVNEYVARKVLNLARKGLTNGLGDPVPGAMCVEAAVCYAYGLPHNDSPPCVNKYVRGFKIDLNDADGWSSDKARGDGMAALAIAQLGSKGKKFRGEQFRSRVNNEYRKWFLPLMLKSIPLPDAADAASQGFDVKAALKSLEGNPSPQRLKSVLNKARIAFQDYHYGDMFGSLLDDSAEAIYAYGQHMNLGDTASTKLLRKLADIGLQVLIDMQSPGTKYLYLLKKK